MIIGLSGYAGSGKSTAAQALIGYGWHPRKFAAPLKGMLQFFLAYQGAAPDHIARMIEGDMKEVLSVMLGGQTPRHAMQTLGTEWGRGWMSESLWVDAAMRNMPGHTVFDDCRFENEAKAIRDRGGKIIQVTRTGVGGTSTHPSECLPVPDLILNNDSTPEEMVLRLTLITTGLEWMWRSSRST